MFKENRLIFKGSAKGSKKPEMLKKTETAQGAPKKAPETKDAKKAELTKKYNKAKDKLKSKTRELMGSLKQNINIEMFIKNIDTMKKLRERMRSAPIGLIEKLEDKYPGLTLAAFTKNIKDAEKLDFKSWSSDKIYSKFKEKTRYKVDFLGNSDAENKWGLSDMLSITMRKVIKYERGNSNLKRVSERRVGLKGQNKDRRGFYDSQGYIAIHTGDEFEFEISNPEFKYLFREKKGNKYLEINERSYEKYAKSKYAKEDAVYMKKHESNRSFISKKPTISNELIMSIREKIGGLEGLAPHQRIIKVAEYLTRPENNIGARHCGDWVDRVYAIAGVKRKRTLYQDLTYAFVDGDVKKGWKPKDDPSRYDCRIEGKYASSSMLNKLQPGDWIWINNRNKYDYAGNHSGIFLGWVNKQAKIAKIACWFRNKPGGQKITTYNLSNMPVTAIHRATEVDDSLPESNPEETTDLPNESRDEMIARGSIPFAIKIGYKLTPEETRWYEKERREAHKLSKMNIMSRLNSLQERYKLMDALKYAAEMVGIGKKDWNYFVALNDAVMRVESNYNAYAFNSIKRNGVRTVALSTAAGEYQILNSVWREFKKYTENSKRGRYLRAQMKRYGINPDMLMKVDFSASRPEYATPYQRCILHNVFMFRYSRILPKLESIDGIFDKIRSTSGKMRRSWMRVVYLYWRNGPNGAAPFIRNLRQGIPLPETEDEMRDYFNNYLKKSDWQKRQGYADFRTVMRVTKVFANRFQQNLDQLGV